MTVKAALIALAVSLVVAAIAYLVGQALTPTYQSYGLIRVALASQGGINDPVVTAANDTATQYAQLASSAPVAALTASKLGIPASDLSNAITGSTVAAQNLVQVTVTGPSAASAQTRAAAASTSLQRYISGLNAADSAQYVARVQASLSLVNQSVQALTARLATDSPAQRASDTTLLQSFDSQREQLLGQVARDAASNEPSLQVVDSSTPATVTSPKPALYALVAFVVAAIITGRVAFVLSRRPRGR